MTDRPSDITRDITPIKGLVDSPAAVKVREAELAEHKRAITEAIQATLGDATVGQVDGTTVVTWRENTVTRIDTKQLKADWPEIADKCTKTTTQRRFLLAD